MKNKLIHWFISRIRMFPQKREIDFYVLNLKNKISRNNEILSSRKHDFLKRNIEIRTLSQSDLTYFKEFLSLRKDLPLASILYKYFLENGCISFLAYLRGKVIGATWVSFNEITLVGLGLDFLPDATQIYGFHSFVKKEYRSRGIMSFLHERVINFSEEKGYRQIVRAIASSNRPSSNLSLRFGFEKYATMATSGYCFMVKNEFTRVKDDSSEVLSFRSAGNKLIKI